MPERLGASFFKFCLPFANKVTTLYTHRRFEMGELAKAVVSTLLFNQSVTVGSKLINNKRVTGSEREGLGIALVAYLFVHLATSNPAPSTPAKH